MSNFAARNLSLGQVNALVKKLGGEAAVLGIIAGTTKFTLEIVEGSTFDEAAFFQPCAGRWVDADLDRYVGLETRSTRSASALNCRQLEVGENEATMFGQSGSDQYAQTLANVCDLGQIAELIAAQEGGKPGVLLNNGCANIFPVRGKDGSLRVVHVFWSGGVRRWYVYCDPFKAVSVWFAGGLVFSN